ncbi:MAG: fibrobacter succinogenes major paralogous domain-containing protein [Prevotellaceae bacterium]|jgi:hypothetical protein|nr:fibrobacter succinogenes major paralogous domain-containing protein [Prevotellaceae bacterium]
MKTLSTSTQNSPFGGRRGLLLLLFLLWAIGGFAQVSVSNMATDYTAKQVSFTLTWTAQPYNNQIWMIVDYIKVQNASTAGNTWKRALVTAVARNSGTGSAATVTGQRGFWLNTSGSSGSTNVTATLSLDAGVQQFNWCAYALNYPPKAEWQSNGSYKLTGTPPFTVNGTTLPAGSLTVGPGTCITSLTDATDNPSADLPATLTVSTSNPAARCDAGAVTLTASASGGTTTAMTYTWTVGSSAAQTTSANTYAPTVAVGGATYSVTATNAAGCSSAANTGTITVHALPTITLLSGNASQTVTLGTAITDIVYTTNVCPTCANTGSLSAGINFTRTSNTMTLSGTPTTVGAHTYLLEARNSTCASFANGTITVVGIEWPPYSGDGAQSFTCSSGQTWSGVLRNPVAGCASVTALTTTNPPPAEYKPSDRYYYNWTCVNTAAAALCPSPWRVPTQDDFNALVSCTNYSAIISKWGYGGLVNGSTISGESNYGYLWSSDSASTDSAYFLLYYSGAMIIPSDAKTYGFQVRCVR